MDPWNNLLFSMSCFLCLTAFLHKINSAHKIYSLIHKMNEGMSLTQRKFRENWNWKKALEAVFLCVLVASTFLLISLYSVLRILDLKSFDLKRKIFICQKIWFEKVSPCLLRFELLTKQIFFYETYSKNIFNEWIFKVNRIN